MLINLVNARICTKCCELKSFEDFNRDKKGKYGIMSVCKVCRQPISKKYRSDNYDEVIKKNREWYWANREYALEKVKQRAMTTRDRKKEYDKEYNEKNKDRKREVSIKYRANNFEKLKAQKQLYRKTPTGKAIDINKGHKRRALERSGDVTTEQMIELRASAKVCYWCGISVVKKKFHIDHYVPLHQGGKHTITNLVISCPTCNMTKSKKDPIDFAMCIGRLL